MVNATKKPTDKMIGKLVGVNPETLNHYHRLLQHHKRKGFPEAEAKTMAFQQMRKLKAENKAAEEAEARAEEEIAIQLEEKQKKVKKKQVRRSKAERVHLGRFQQESAPGAEVVAWVAKYAMAEGVQPEDCICPVAWNLLRMVQKDEGFAKQFWLDYVKGATKSNAEVVIERYRDSGLPAQEIIDTLQQVNKKLLMETES